MTQEEMARKIGITRQYLNQILRKKLVPSIPLAEKVSKVTGVGFFELRPDLKKILKNHI